MEKVSALIDELRVRPALEEDIAGIADVHLRSFKHAYKDIMNEDFLMKKTYEKYFDSTKKQFDKKKVLTLVAIKNGMIVGYCDWEAFQFHNSQEVSENLRKYLQELNNKEKLLNLKKHKLQEITSLYIDPHMLKQGIGRKLLKKTFQILKEKNFKTVIIWAFEQNINACEFYQKLGGIPYKNKAITTMPDGTKHQELLFTFNLETN